MVLSLIETSFGSPVKLRTATPPLVEAMPAALADVATFWSMWLPVRLGRCSVQTVWR